MEATLRSVFGAACTYVDSDQAEHAFIGVLAGGETLEGAKPGAIASLHVEQDALGFTPERGGVVIMPANAGLIVGEYSVMEIERKQSGCLVLFLAWRRSI